MRAITFHEPRTVRVEDVPDPRIEAPTDAIVRVRLAAVCGSDLHVYHGRETGLDAGCVLGHEFLGEVVETGAEVRLARGAVVVSPFTTSCGACFYCRDGLTARCERGALFGWVQDGRGLAGAQAEYVRVPLADATLVRVPDGAREDEALLAGDVLATGFFCAENGGAGPGRAVAVVGCGPVGLMAIVGARELGAETILAFDTIDERLRLAERFGATPVNAANGAIDAIRDVTEGRGADVVLEAVGAPSASRLAVDLVRPGGVVSIVGVHTSEHFAFSPVEAYDKNLTIRIGRCPARRFAERLVSLVAARRYDLASIFSHRMPLADGVRAYDLFDRKVDGCTKVLLEP